VCNNVRIQLPLELKRKFQFLHCRENFRIFVETSQRKLTKIVETLMIWTTWGMGHKIEFCLLKLVISEHYFIKI
jgi:hypothetical protein